MAACVLMTQSSVGDSKRSRNSHHAFEGHQADKKSLGVISSCVVQTNTRVRVRVKHLISPGNLSSGKIEKGLYFCLLRLSPQIWAMQFLEASPINPSK